MEFTFKFTAEEVSIIGMALGELQYKQVRPLIEKMQAQINEQEKAENVKSDAEASRAS